jgi:hypothetical protein
VDENIKKDQIGEITMEALDFWFNLTNFQMFATIHKNFNGLFNDMHLKLIR